MSPTTTTNGARLDELLARVAAMPIRELAALPRDEVRAWPDEVREARRERMFGSRRRVKIPHIADMGGVGRDAVAKWRGHNLKTGEVNVHGLLMPILSEDEIGPDGRELVEAGRKPSRDWHEGDVWRWYDDTDRLDYDLYPPEEGRAGRKPSGRPPRPRTGD